VIKSCGVGSGASMVDALKNRSVYACWAVGLLGLAALVFFDVGPNLASNDDWMFAWSVKQLVLGHGILRVPDLAPLGLVQTVWAAVVTLGHIDYRLLRLSAVPFVLLAVYCTYRLSRNLGSNSFWAAVAGSSLLAAPIFLALATTFMSEVFYLGLLMAIALTGERWVSRGRLAPLCVLLTALGFLERQTAIYIPMAITVGLLLAKRERVVTRREWTYLAAIWLTVGGLLLFVERVGLDTATSGRAMSILQHPSFRNILFSAMMLPGMLGLICSPFAAGLVGRRGGAPSGSSGGDLSSRKRMRKVLAALFVLSVADAIVLSISSVPILPGDYLKIVGLGPGHMSGMKPSLFPSWLYFTIEAIALASALALLLGGRGRTDRPRWPAGVKFLLVLGALQLIPLVFGPIFDRYYLPGLGPVLPVVALLASNRKARFADAARVWAIAAMIAGVAIYVAGEQDYQAWQQARDTAAKRAFSTVAPSLIDAGFEANGVFTELPNYEAHGIPKRAPILDPGRLPSVVGPPHPVLRLMFAPANDPREGVTYSSVAPGRIVIAPVP
jgi:Dolichyl-phosphate-mannose-protein mannosyltransferase